MNDNKAKEEMLEYMRNKYNEEFTFISFNNHAEWRQPTNDIVVEPAAFPGEKFVGVCRDKKTGKMSDGYLALKVNADVEKEISAVASEVYGENRVFNNAQTMAQPNITLPDISAPDFLKSNGYTQAYVFITSNLSDKEKDVEAFRQVLKNKGYYVTFHILYIEEKILQTVNEENYVELFGSRGQKSSEIIASGRFRNDESFEFVYYEWE